MIENCVVLLHEEISKDSESTDIKFGESYDTHFLITNHVLCSFKLEGGATAEGELQIWVIFRVEYPCADYLPIFRMVNTTISLLVEELEY